ncbi:uncharacterized protein LOC120347121 [Styela clava]
MAFEDENDIMDYILRRSSMVRYMIDPNFYQVPPTEFKYDEDDEDNILIQDEVKRDICSVASSKTIIGRAEMDYIHKYFFEDNLPAIQQYKTTEDSNNLKTKEPSSRVFMRMHGEQGVPLDAESRLKVSVTQARQSMQSEISHQTEVLSSISGMTIQNSHVSSCGYDADDSSEDDEVSSNKETSSSSLKSKTPDSHQSTSHVDSAVSSNYPSNNDLSSSSRITSGIKGGVPKSLTSSKSTETFKIISEPGTSEMTRSSEVVNDKILIRSDHQQTFAEILTSDELSGFVYRSFLATNDDCSSFEIDRLDSTSSLSTTTKRRNKSGSKNFITDKKILMVVLDFWRDVEEYRRKYSMLESHELQYEHWAIMRTYVYSEILSDLFSVSHLLKNLHQALKNLPFGDPALFTSKLLDLQNNIQQVLESEWVLFASEDRYKFQISVRPLVWKIGRRRSSFPSCVEEVRNIPIFRVEKSYNDHSDNDARKNTDKRKSYMRRQSLSAFLGSRQSFRMKYRSSRAVHLLLMCVRGAPYPFHKIYGYSNNDQDCDVRADLDSDSDGSLLHVPRRKYYRFPNIDSKILAKMSAKEYPRQGIDYSKCKVIRVVERHRVNRKPMYLRPITKGGTVFERPSKKPKNLLEILRDPTHFMFFKRYMRMQNSEAPLLFWKSIDLLKRTDHAASRQRKAQGIMKKFFSKAAGGGVLLQCDDELIKEIGRIESVTTSMLVEAQGLVYASMEKNWGARYLRTFQDDVEEEEEREEEHIPTNDITQSRPWKVFGDFIRRGAAFMRAMRNKVILKEFCNYLKNLPSNVDIMATGDASSSVEMFQTAILRNNDDDVSQRITVRKILNNRVVLEHVQNDLLMWIEVDKFNTLLENAQALMLSGCNDKSDQEIVRAKAQKIIECFFDSPVLPRLRVNSNTDVSNKLIEAYHAGEIDRALFHYAVISVFPHLLHFWKKYREEKFCYLSRKAIRMNRHEEVKRRRESISRRRIRHFKRLLNMKTSEKSLTDLNAGFPDYVHGLSRLKSPFERVKGIVHDDLPTLHFSLQHGLKFIIPPKRKMSGLEDSEEEDEGIFMKVWTRRAKPVTVLGVGSNPKLLNTEERQKTNYNVKCDLMD